MEKIVNPIFLNLGCGNNKLPGYVNVDAYGEPDLLWNLNEFPYPWEDNSIASIEMTHVLEHLDDWWGAFKECARILKPGGALHIRVPDESSMTALTYRDHNHVFSMVSFHGVLGLCSGTNSWAETEEHSVPLRLETYMQAPHQQYNWMLKFPRILRFCADHLRNFIHEQRFLFRKVG
jgi:ubiquinone/menaquinone biosynthesis C-methylase UbiE